MPITLGYQALLDEANARIETLSVAAAAGLLDDPDTQFVDIRDIRELERTGTIPGAFHAPRGMLEFWVDPACQYFKPEFGQNKRFVFFCALSWRSALATDMMQRMGLSPVCHIEGGFAAWKAAGLPIAPVAIKS